MTFELAHQRIEEELAKINLQSQPEQLYAPIAYTLEPGGKRIRPSLCLMACDALGGDVEKAIYPALALEIFHNFTLLHDDIMDKDDMRRNRPTVHKRWNENVAILSGDAMQILAYKYLAMMPVEYLKPVLDVFNDTAIKVCEGQQYDVDFETNEKIGVEDYIMMIEYKTAVLIEASLKIGAIVAGGTHEQIELFGKFGNNLGLAFQFRDDWLDTFGDEETFGKAIGSDIVNNKKTYLLITALQLAAGDLLKELWDSLYTANYESEKKISKVKAIFKQLGIDELAQRQTERYYEASITAINQLQIKDKEAFVALAEKLLQRSK